MKTTRLRHGWGLAALGLLLSLTTGCQTWIGGMTLPSGHYLQHPPQYFKESPAFPLTRELARQEEIAAMPGPGTGAPVAPLPPAVPALPPGP